MSYTLSPIALTENVTSYVSIPGDLGAVSWVKITNASPYLLLLTNLLGGQDYLQPGECNVWPVPGLTSAIQATPQAFLVSPSVIPVSYLVVTWYGQDEQPSGTYPVNFNALQYLGNAVTPSSAANAFEQDFLTPFVLTGLTAAKDGGIANQLDVAAGIAFLRQPDSGLGRVAPQATTYLTATPNATYYLDLNPDGTWSWGTTHSTIGNYLTIAQCTTDASANIATVTDERTLTTTLLSGASGTLTYPRTLDATHIAANADLSATGANGNVQLGSTSAANTPYIDFHSEGGTQADVRLTASGGTAGSFGKGTLTVKAAALAVSGVVSSLGGQATAGSFGASVIVAQAISTHVTTIAVNIVLTFAPPADGLYRASLYAFVGNATSPATITADVNWADPNDTTHTQTEYFTVQNAATGGATPVTLKGASVATGPGSAALACFPITIYVKSGLAQGIDIRYTDQTGTPNDFVSVMIERLS